MHSRARALKWPGGGCVSSSAPPPLPRTASPHSPAAYRRAQRSRRSSCGAIPRPRRPRTVPAASSTSLRACPHFASRQCQSCGCGAGWGLVSVVISTSTLTCPPTHSPTHPPTHSPTHLLTHSLAPMHIPIALILTALWTLCPLSLLHRLRLPSSCPPLPYTRMK